MGKDKEYLFRVAANVRGQIGAFSFAGGEDVHAYAGPDDDLYPRAFWTSYGDKIRIAIAKFGPEARGKVAVLGEQGAIWRNLYIDSLPTAHSWNEVLTLQASCVIASAIVDLVRADLKKMRGGRDCDRESETWHESGSRSVSQGHGWRSERGHHSVNHSVTGHSSRP